MSEVVLTLVCFICVQILLALERVERDEDLTYEVRGFWVYELLNDLSSNLPACIYLSQTI